MVGLTEPHPRAQHKGLQKPQYPQPCVMQWTTLSHSHCHFAIAFIQVLKC